MKVTIAALAACICATAFTAPAMADNLVIQVGPQHSYDREYRHHRRNFVDQRVIVRPVERRHVYVRDECYVKTVKKIYNNKTVITKKRVCR